jgi:hypothetical protein
MRAMLGEQGTEQFTIETEVEGKTIKVQLIHDPFIHSTVVTTLSFWGCFLGLFIPKRRTIRTVIIVRGSEGAQRAIMMLDPEQLSLDTNEILEARRIARETSGTGGSCLYVSN